MNGDRKVRAIGPWAAVLLMAGFVAGAAHAETGAIAASAEETKPLKAGVAAPDAALKTPEGESVKLKALWSEQPLALVFYRGGWCPYCTKHLSTLKDIEDELLAMGYEILAVSPDKPAKLQEAAKKHALNYQLMSDSSATAMKAFGVAFRVDDETVERYKGFNIDLEAVSGETHHALPVPAVFLIDREGVIRWVHADPDYTKRIANDDLLAAARTATGR